jgi:FkbM family methyltransferase
MTMSAGSTTSTIFLRDFGPVTLQHQGTPSSLRIARAILAGRTYPAVPFVRDVASVLDVGANIGAAAIFFANLYPAARVYALEPASEAFALLASNTRLWRNVTCFPFGLSGADRTATLYKGAHESVEASLHRSVRSADEHEQIALRAASAFLADERLADVDVLKLDVEGCEMDVLEALGSVVAAIKILYVEYHSERDRRLIDGLLAGSHVLWRAKVELVHRGEFCYIRGDLLPPDCSELSPELAPQLS